MVSHAIERLVQLMIAVAIISLAWWGLTHPAIAAGFIVTIVGGVVHFVSYIITGIAGLFH